MQINKWVKLINNYNKLLQIFSIFKIKNILFNQFPAHIILVIIISNQSNYILIKLNHKINYKHLKFNNNQTYE